MKSYCSNVFGIGILHKNTMVHAGTIQPTRSPVAGCGAHLQRIHSVGVSLQRVQTHPLQGVPHLHQVVVRTAHHTLAVVLHAESRGGELDVTLDSAVHMLYTCIHTEGNLGLGLGCHNGLSSTHACTLRAGEGNLGLGLGCHTGLSSTHAAF